MPNLQQCLFIRTCFASVLCAGFVFGGCQKQSADSNLARVEDSGLPTVEVSTGEFRYLARRQRLTRPFGDAERLAYAASILSQSGYEPVGNQAIVKGGSPDSAAVLVQKTIKRDESKPRILLVCPSHDRLFALASVLSLSQSVASLAKEVSSLAVLIPASDNLSSEVERLIHSWRSDATMVVEAERKDENGAIVLQMYSSPWQRENVAAVLRDMSLEKQGELTFLQFPTKQAISSLKSASKTYVHVGMNAPDYAVSEQDAASIGSKSMPILWKTYFGVVKGLSLKK